MTVSTLGSGFTSDDDEGYACEAADFSELLEEICPWESLAICYDSEGFIPFQTIPWHWLKGGLIECSGRYQLRQGCPRSLPNIQCLEDLHKRFISCEYGKECHFEKLSSTDGLDVVLDAVIDRAELTMMCLPDMRFADLSNSGEMDLAEAFIVTRSIEDAMRRLLEVADKDSIRYITISQVWDEHGTCSIKLNKIATQLTGCPRDESKLVWAGSDAPTLPLKHVHLQIFDFEVHGTPFELVHECERVFDVEVVDGDQ